jgi:group I intron endonuclease
MEDKKYLIYKVTNKSNNKSYIGLTCRDFETRRYEHIYESNCDSVFKFHQALRKYPSDNFIWEILENSLESIKIANEREIYYIQHFDSYSNGYNMTKGGGGRDNYFFSTLARERMRQAKLDKPLSTKHANKIGDSLRGVPKSPEHRLNVINSLTGLKRSEEYCLNASKRMEGKYIGNKNPSAIKVNIYNSDMILKYECLGNFERICNENGLPTKALRKSYYNNGKPIYLGKTIKKEVLLLNTEFIGWYAVKILS